MPVSASLRSLMLVSILHAFGCGARPEPLGSVTDPPADVPELATHFIPASTGNIRGRVVWDGPLPEKTSYRDARVIPGLSAARFDELNQVFPRIDGRRGVGGAVVMLRGIDPAVSRSWDLPSVRLQLENGYLHALQGESKGQIGFVHRGERVEMVSLSGPLDLLRARGAEFFTVPFAEIGKPVHRTFKASGITEFSSAAGNFWVRAWVFTCDHPYHVLSTSSGEFVLDQVPEGTYELICWLPDWRVERFERDPETFSIARVWHRQPLEKGMTIRVTRGMVADVEFHLSATEFPGSQRHE